MKEREEVPGLENPYLQLVTSIEKAKDEAARAKRQPAWKRWLAALIGVGTFGLFSFGAVSCGAQTDCRFTSGSFYNCQQNKYL